MVRFRIVMFPLLSCLGALFLGGASAAGEKFSLKSVPLVELFTSQGCNACPPADAFLNELAARPDILALSWAVDYWDYLGWQDTLAQPENAARQRAYNEAMGRSGVYTPQMIIDGRHQAVGSRRAEVEAFLTEALTNLQRPELSIEYTADGPATLMLKGKTGDAAANLLLVVFAPAVTEEIGGGENAGKTITYSHVVRRLARVGEWPGGRMKTELPAQAADPASEACAILVQEGEAGPILAAAMLPKGC